VSNKELSLIQDDVRHKWLSIAEGVYFAFQPIVNIYTGAAYGVEALLRGYQEQGFESIFALIDEAYQDQALYTLDLSLRRKALEQFCQHPLSRHGRLFYNLDNRTLEMPDYSTGNTHAILDALNLDKHSLCFEISERHQFQDISKVQQILNQYESEGLSISIDDFGTGYSGLQLLYQADPEIIKIDRFFISAINQDIKKKMFISKIVKLAHLMGIKVIAEGVETEEEYYHCKNIGCDLLQGYFVARPLGSIQEVQMHYLHVHKLAKKEKRMSRDNQSALEKHIDHIKPVDRDGSLLQLLKHFRLDKDLDFYPSTGSAAFSPGHHPGKGSQGVRLFPLRYFSFGEQKPYP
jgi:EAL domain-containing protein (putative c-di-GMP-specific phosphodiesterase class I)